MTEPIVTVEKLVKNYGSTKAVDRISFEVNAGEIFSLIGPNGAGKSTTLRMLATLLSPSGGQAKINGHNLTKEAHLVRQVISYLPEEAGAYKNLTGRQYLEFMAALFEYDKASYQKAIEFGTEVCGLGKRLQDKISTYSKGMTRKLLIARTVMTRPKLAILDEPTSGLDVVNAFEVRSIIKNLAQQGMAVLLSSHNMLEIEFLSDRVGLIDQGRILAIGTAPSLKKKYNAKNLEEVFVEIVK